MIYDIIIIGAGPAGMSAAITAARNKKRVCLIEHKERVGKKILSTGNGKCNITNMNISRECYFSSSDKDFYKVIEKFGPDDVRNFFMSMGLVTKSKNGYVYPNSEQASSVLDALRFELDNYSIDVMTDTDIHSITMKNNIFNLSTGKGKHLCAKKLIVAAGSKCAPKTGSDGSGYDIAGNFGHRIVKVIPALVQIICKEGFFKEIQGVRTDAIINVYDNDTIIASERGELQLTAYGISGIPVFILSRTIKRIIDLGHKPYVIIDLVPDLSENDLENIIKNIKLHNSNIDMSVVLGGIINKKLANLIAKITKNMSIVHVAHTIKNFKATPTDTNGFDNAQVCAGGVSLDEINLDTMESIKVPNLYFAGEILDVDGKCGGYNLQWAFSSGVLAGKSASERDI